MASHHLKATPETVFWGRLPSRRDTPVICIPSGAVLTVETISHEGMVEDQGLDPVAFFGRFGVGPDGVHPAAAAVAASGIDRDFDGDGPHVIVGPVAVEGAMPGDVLKVEMLDFAPSVPYGVIANRHGKGALAGEFPENRKREDDASPERPESYGNVSVFAAIRRDGRGWRGVIELGDGELSFPATPFLGTLGTTPDTDDNWNSIPPSRIGGNIDIKELIAGATLYLPVEVEGAGFFTGDPHFAQGDGEVALSALEGSLDATLRLTVLKKGSPDIPASDDDTLRSPFAETENHWVCVGLHRDLDEAMKMAVRKAIAFLAGQFGLERHMALAYLSAAADFEISQVVDRTKGVHALIRKADFAPFIEYELRAGRDTLPVRLADGLCHVEADGLCRALDLGWKVEDQRLTVETPSGAVEAVAGSLFCRRGDREARLPAPPILRDGEFLLPTAALGDMLDVVVTWSTRGRRVVGEIWRG